MQNIFQICDYISDDDKHDYSPKRNDILVPVKTIDLIENIINSANIKLIKHCKTSPHEYVNLKLGSFNITNEYEFPLIKAAMEKYYGKNLRIMCGGNKNNQNNSVLYIVEIFVANVNAFKPKPIDSVDRLDLENWIKQFDGYLWKFSNKKY